MDRLGNQIWFFGSGSNNIEKLKIKLEFLFSYLANYEEIKRGGKFKYNIYSILNYAPLHFLLNFVFFSKSVNQSFTSALADAFYNEILFFGWPLVPAAPTNSRVRDGQKTVNFANFCTLPI